jgi:hypothetical protein
VQIAPIKPTLKAPGYERLKLEHDNLLSRFAFNFNLRRYTTVYGALLAVLIAVAIVYVPGKAGR